MGFYGDDFIIFRLTQQFFLASFCNLPKKKIVHKFLVKLGHHFILFLFLTNNQIE